MAELIQQYERIAEQYATARDIKLSRLSYLIFTDAYFFDRLKTGRVTLRLTQKFLQFVSDDWPENLEWPQTIPRPNPRGRLCSQ